MPGKRPNRGLALVAVIATLVALVLVALPFAIQMGNAARRAEQRLFTVRAEQEAESVFRLGVLWLRRGGDREIPPGWLDEFNRGAGGGRVWDLRVEPEAGKVDVSTAPFTLLGNLLGGTVLAEDLVEGATQVFLADGEGLPEGGGVVRIGGEVCRYAYREGSRLAGVTRGVDEGGDWQTEPRRWRKGTWVVPEAAFLVASGTLRTDPGAYRPWQNLFELRRVADLGAAALPPDDLAAAAATLTCWSQGPGAETFTNDQTLRSSVSASEREGGATELLVDDPSYFGPGTVVRITDRVSTDYGLVLENDGRKVTLVNPVKHDYEAERTVVSGLVRHPLHLNQASESVVAACLTGLSLRHHERDAVDAATAKELARRLRAKPIESRYGLREVYREALREGLISGNQFRALYLDALNPNDARLAFSTVAFAFDRGDTFTLTATAVLSSRAGEELARRSIRRVVTVPPSGSEVLGLASQEDFERSIVATRDGKWTMTFPFNTGGQWDGTRIPASRYRAHVERNLFPSSDRGDGVGDVRLLPERLGLPGVFHFDESDYADGEYVNDRAFTLSTRDRRVDLLEDVGMKPFSVSFWVKPYWGGRGGVDYLFDCGEEDWTNRISLLFSPDRSELVLRVADATLEERAAEVRYEVTPESFADDTWYHVTAEIKGSRPGDQTLMIDGRAVGRSAYRTKLTASVAGFDGYQDDLDTLPVEDTTDFPDRGALLLRGPGGKEILEYDGKTDTGFTITSRTARRAQLLNDQSYQPDAFPEGTPVELLGYANPILTDIRRGGATLPADLGAYHAFRVTFDEDVIYAPVTAGGTSSGEKDAAGAEPPVVLAADAVGGGGAGDGSGGAVGEPGSAGTGGSGDETETVPIRGMAADRWSVDLVLGEDLVSYLDEIPDEETLKAFGPHGFAIFSTWGKSKDLVPGVQVGGREVVYYEKIPNGLHIERYQSTKQLPASYPYFAFADDANGANDRLGVVGKVSGVVNVPWAENALIPISLELKGTDPELYYDVTQEDYLTTAYVVLDDEWIRYTYADADTVPGSLLLVYDPPALYSEAHLKQDYGLGIYRGGGSGDVEPPEGIPHEDGPPGDREGPGEPPSGPPDGPPTEPPGGEGDSGPPDSGGDPIPEPPAPPDPPAGEDDGTSADQAPPPAPPPPGGPPPPPAGEDDGTDPGPGGGEEPPLPVPPTGEDDGGPTGGPTEPPLPPDSGGTPEEEAPEAEPPAAEPPDDGREAPSDAAGDETGSEEEEEPGPTGGSGPKGDPGGHRVSYLFGDKVFGSDPHDAGTVGIAAFVGGAHDGLHFGPGDRVTVATAAGPQEEMRIHLVRVEQPYIIFIDVDTVAATVWIAPEEPPGGRYDFTESEADGILAGTVDTRRVTRLLKFPSGELPTDLGDELTICGRSEGRASPAFLDELWFPPDRDGSWYRVGRGSSAAERYEYSLRGWYLFPIDSITMVEPDDEGIPIHQRPTSANTDGLPVDGLPEDGGVVRIGDELVIYDHLDTAGGMLEGCRRGAFGTEPALHGFDERVTVMDAAVVGFLADGLSASGPEITLGDASRFPDAGWLRIGGEILGYTGKSGNTLFMPEKLPEKGDPGRTREGLFRGRFGTTAAGYEAGEPVILFPVRHPDRHVFEGAHPQASALILRKEVTGALMKRLAWDENLPEGTELEVTARFDGTPDWDSEKVYDVSAKKPDDGDEKAFKASPKSYLFRFDDPHGENRLMIQADRIEIRFAFRYAGGAFEWDADDPPDGWKASPWVKAVRVEYLAPSSVGYTEPR